MVVKQPGAGLRSLQLLEVHGSGLLVVDRVQKVLLLGVECDDGSQDQQLNAAALQQVDLLHLNNQPASIYSHTLQLTHLTLPGGVA